MSKRRLRLIDNWAWADIADDDVPGTDTEHEDAEALRDVIENALPGDIPEAVAQAEEPEEGPFEDDFTHNLRQIGEAGVVPGFGPVDDLNQNFQLGEIKRDENNERAPYVRTNPPSAYKAVLGNEVQVQAGGPEIDCVRWTGDTDDESTVITITFANLGAIGGATGFPNESASYRPYAIVQWGTSGFKAQAKIDLGRGQQVTVSGSTVYVRVGMDAARSTYTNGTMKISAMISFRAIQRNVPATSTAYIDALSDGGTSTVIIPNFAVTLLPVMRSNLTASLLINIQDVAGVQISSLFFASGEEMSYPVELPNDAYKIAFRVDGGASDVRPVFGLSM